MIEELMKDLSLYGALSYFEKMKDEKQDLSSFLLQMLKSESCLREEKRMERRLKTASFPYEREWAHLDESKNPKVPYKKLKSYSTGKFIEGNKNLCFIGAPGLGKTHSLVAIGRDLCRKGYTVKFYSAIELATKLEEAKDEMRLSKLMASLMKPNLLIIDELGFIPLNEVGSRLLFDVFSKRYDKGPIAVTTNLSLPKWVQTFGSVEMTNALIDRFTHRCDIHIFEGESYRFLESKKRS